MTLIWSLELSPGNLIPGVIITNFVFFRTINASCAEQTSHHNQIFLLDQLVLKLVA